MKHRLVPTLPVPNPTRSYWHTTHPNPLVSHRTTSTLPSTAPVIVIGSGISGAFCARELAAQGIKDILVLEARDICSGATGRNGGHCQPQIFSHAADPHLASFELANFASLSHLITTHSIPCDFSPFAAGGCHAFYSASAFSAAEAQVSALQTSAPDLWRQINVISDPASLRDLRIPHAVGAITQTHAAGVHPYKLVTWVWGGLLSRGAVNLQTNTAVTSISKGEEGDPGPGLKGGPPEQELTDGTWTVHTARGDVSAKHVILTTNAYTAHLLPEMRGLIVPVQGEMSALRARGELLGSPLSHDYSFGGVMEQGEGQDDYLVQRPLETGGELMFGGGRVRARGEGVGVSDDSRVDDGAARYLRSMLPRLMAVDVDSSMKVEGRGLPERYEGFEEVEKGEEMEALAQWTGVMGFSRDGHPWVGGVPGKQGLWVCGGYTGHGMPNASLCAQHIARLVAAENLVLNGGTWGASVAHDVKTYRIPAEFVLTKERMQRARQLPDIGEPGAVSG